MNSKEKQDFIEGLVSGIDKTTEIKTRKSMYIYTTVPNKQDDNKKKHIERGWEIDKEFKTITRLRIKKDNKHLLVDRIWSLFALLGFDLLNQNQVINIPCDKTDRSIFETFNILAKDKESIVLVRCESASVNSKSNFKDKLELLKQHIGEVKKNINYIFDGAKLKFKFILVTENFAFQEQDKLVLENIGGVHFDEDIVEYYINMHNQIGIAARYQLLGSLFFDQEIPEMENKIPAIRGRMGGHVYYSFSIEPEKLLKIGYVLHRNKANTNMMPTYQRIIQKSRLDAIKRFIEDDKGYFPNSIIISLDSGKRKKLEFQESNNISSTIADLGILHLPKKYRSAYIIDGQHRLYGYANSKYMSTNTIPVVAFENLERNEQVKLFMQINENQKAVSKNLRNTLNADLLWNSENYLEQMTALRSRIAILLGEDRASALYGKISVGEDKKVITTQQIDNALKKSVFFGKVSKDKIERQSIFYKGNLDYTFDKLSKFILKSLDFLKDKLEIEWEKPDGIIVINKGIYAIIMILI